MIKKFGDFFSEAPNESQAEKSLYEQKPCPIKGEYCKYYLGYDATLKVDEDVDGAYVFEFPSTVVMNSFLEEVGGMPHPHGGPRAVLTYKDEEIPEALKESELKSPKLQALKQHYKVKEEDGAIIVHIKSGHDFPWKVAKKDGKFKLYKAFSARTYMKPTWTSKGVFDTEDAA